MPVIKICNKSDDDIIITIDGTEKIICDNESVTLENQSKGEHTLNVHRKRIPKETIDINNAPKGLEILKNQDEKPGSHIQLDLNAVFNSAASKCTVEITQKIKGVESYFEDVIFAGYSVQITGGKSVSEKDCFADKKIEKAFFSQQLKNALFPVGLIGIIILLLGALLSVFYFADINFIVKGKDVGPLRCLLLFAAGVLATGYFCVNIYKIKKRCKEYSCNEK